MLPDGLASNLFAHCTRGLATGLLVATALAVARYSGARISGLLAAVPVTSAPALAWIGYDRGAAFAAEAALSSLHATGLTAVFVLAYGLLATRCGRAVALCLAGALTVTVGAITSNYAAYLAGAASFSVMAIAGALYWLPADAAAPAPHAARRFDGLTTAGVCGCMTLLVSSCAQQLSTQWRGLIAAVPLVGLSTMWYVHGRSSASTLRLFLRAYAHGMLAKAVFIGGLAMALPSAGLVGSWGFALAAAVAVLSWPALSRRTKPAVVHIEAMR